MEVEKQEWDAIKKALTAWEDDGLISPEKNRELRQSVKLKRNDRQQVARYFFIVAISCTLLSFGAIFLDEKLLEKLKVYFALSNVFIATIMAGLATAWFWFVNKRRARYSPFAWEVYMVLGGLTVLCALVYICKDTGFGANNNGMLITASALLFLLAASFRSSVLWIGGLLALLSWFGALTSWQSKQDMFMGLNYPARYTLFGLLVIGASFLLQSIPSAKRFHRLTYISGLIIFLTSLWAVSVFGNFAHLDEWAKVRQVYVLFYGAIFGVVAAAVFYLGIRYDDDFTRDAGVIYLLLNLYSRYFEFFWDSMNKGLFFLVLAVSFWFIGRRLEKRRRKRLHKKLPF
jgi:uncharacterized membrane protein